MEVTEMILEILFKRMVLLAEAVLLGIVITHVLDVLIVEDDMQLEPLNILTMVLS